MSTTETKTQRAVSSKSNDGASITEFQNSMDRTLTEIRSSRRLEKIVSSIESFLASQVNRLEEAIDECQKTVDNDRIVQELMAEFEEKRDHWEKKRLAEIQRLKDAGDKLADGWKQLEEARRVWADEKQGR